MIFKKLAEFFEEKPYRDVINTLNTLLTRLDFENNFDGQYFETTISSHFDPTYIWEQNIAYSAAVTVLAPDNNVYICLTNHTSSFVLGGNYENFKSDLDAGRWQIKTNDTIIKHNLGKIPSGFLVYDQNGGGLILRGDTEWTSQAAYLKNQSPIDAEVKLIIFR